MLYYRLNMTSNYSNLLNSKLPSERLSLLKDIGREAAAANTRAYLVGGFVRDLVMGAANLDIDIALEGDSVGFIDKYAAAKAARVTKHDKFGTATLNLNDLRLDFSMTRTESYPSPGVLPVVKPGNIVEDMRRRDITINAMALSISQDDFGALIDPHGGGADLDAKKIRILHDNSFVDDPTRIPRAIRYEQRFDFAIEPHTLALLQRDMAGLGKITGDRVRHELEKIFQEERPELSLARAQELGVLQQMVPGFQDANLKRRISDLRLVADDQPSAEAHFAALLCGLTKTDADAIASRLNLSQKARKAISDARAIIGSELLHKEGIAPSQLYETLNKFSDDGVIAALASTEPKHFKENVHFYWAQLRHAETSLNGEDVIKLGVPAGAKVGQVLEMLLKRRLDGELKSEQDEREFIKLWLQQK